MGSAVDRLRGELRSLENELPGHQATLERVRALLDKADKRLDEGQDKRRWSQVLDNLERALDQAKARVVFCELEIQHRKHKIEELVATGAEEQRESGAAPEAPGLTQEQIAALKASGINVEGMSHEDLVALGLTPISIEESERFLSIPLDQLSQMSLDEVEQLHGQLLAAGAEEPAAAAKKPASPKPAIPVSPIKAPPRRPVNSLRPKRDAGHDQTSLYEQHKQKTLRVAMQKIREDHLDMLTLEEIDIVMGFYDRLTEQVHADASVADTGDAFGGMMAKLSDKCAELRRRRAQMYARRRH